MSNRKPYILLIAVGCLLTAEYAAARPDYYTSGFYTRGPDEAAYIDQGGIVAPFYIPAKNWALIPRFTVEATYDDNYFATESNKEDATEINLVPGLLLMVGRPDHNHLYVDGGTAIPLYQSQSDLDDGNDYFITAGGVYQTGKSQMHGRFGHRRTEGVNDWVGERVVDMNYIGDINVEHRVSQKTSLGLIGSTDWHEYDDDGYNNYHRYYGAGRVYRRMTAKSDLFLQAGAGLDDLDDEEAGEYADATFYDLSVGMRGKPSPKTSVSGRVGYRTRMSDDDEIGDENGWIANIGADATPFGLSTFSIELMSDIRPDVTRSADSSTDQRVTLGVNRRLFTERLRGNAAVDFGQVSYDGENDRSDEDYWGFNLGLDWWTRRNISFGLLYSYTDRSGDDYNSYDSNRLTLRMSWNY